MKGKGSQHTALWYYLAKLLVSLKLTKPPSTSQTHLKWLALFFSSLLFFLHCVASEGFAYIRKQEKGGKGMFHQQQK
jgi:hypothetical protein